MSKRKSDEMDVAGLEVLEPTVKKVREESKGGRQQGEQASQAAHETSAEQSLRVSDGVKVGNRVRTAKPKQPFTVTAETTDEEINEATKNKTGIDAFEAHVNYLEARAWLQHQKQQQRETAAEHNLRIGHGVEVDNAPEETQPAGKPTDDEVLDAARNDPYRALRNKIAHRRQLQMQRRLRADALYQKRQEKADIIPARKPKGVDWDDKHMGGIYDLVEDEDGDIVVEGDSARTVDGKVGFRVTRDEKGRATIYERGKPSEAEADDVDWVPGNEGDAADELHADAARPGRDGDGSPSESDGDGDEDDDGESLGSADTWSSTNNDDDDEGSEGPVSEFDQD